VYERNSADCVLIVTNLTFKIHPCLT